MAVLEPPEAYLILRQAGDQLEEYARLAVAHEGTPAAANGRAMLNALAKLQASARWLREQQAAEHADAIDQAGGDVEWLSTADVGKVLEVGSRQVGNLIDKGRGPLRAVLVKGAWRVRADDLEDFRRSRADVAG